MNLVYMVRYIDVRLARVGTESRAADGRRRGAGFIEGGEGEAEGENERADVSEVIEATGHPGRKSHESRASGREQCRAALLVRLLPPPLPRHLSVPSSFSSSSISSSSLEDFSSLPPFSNVRLCVPYEAIPPSQSPSALLRVASVLIRFDPSRRLTLKQTLFMTRGIIAKRAAVWWPAIFRADIVLASGPAFSLRTAAETRRDERAPRGKGGRRKRKRWSSTEEAEGEWEKLSRTDPVSLIQTAPELGDGILSW